jgi:hypothetical protein
MNTFLELCERRKYVLKLKGMNISIFVTHMSLVLQYFLVISLHISSS